MIITVDGVAGSGKSTIAKLLAKRMRYIYLNTGKMYRCLTAYLLTKHPQMVEDFDSVAPLIDANFLENIDCQLDVEDGAMQISLDQRDYSSQLSSTNTLQCVSQVAALAPVRAIVRQWQMDFSDLAKNLNRGLVAEGRDMGSVIFPSAEKKFFFWADPQVRAQRRYQQLLSAGTLEDRTEQSILDEIQRRDSEDAGRAISPLIKPEGAIEVDTSSMSQEQVLDHVLQFFRD